VSLKGGHDLLRPGADRQLGREMKAERERGRHGRQ
jgi:hypothetical protein